MCELLEVSMIQAFHAKTTALIWPYHTDCPSIAGGQALVDKANCRYWQQSTGLIIWAYAVHSSNCCCQQALQIMVDAPSDRDLFEFPNFSPRVSAADTVSSSEVLQKFRLIGIT